MNSGNLERILAFFHPDFEVTIPPAVSAEPDTYRGYDGIRRYLESFRAEMDEIRFLPERFWDAGDDVVVELRVTAKGKSTAIPVELRTGQVWTIADGKATAARVYPDAGAALDAVGLRD